MNEAIQDREHLRKQIETKSLHELEKCLKTWQINIKNFKYNTRRKYGICYRESICREIRNFNFRISTTRRKPWYIS